MERKHTILERTDRIILNVNILQTFCEKHLIMLILINKSLDILCNILNNLRYVYMVIVWQDIL